MAIVSFKQPTDVLFLPTTYTGSNSASTTEVYTRANSLAEGYAFCEGTFTGFISGTIRRAVIDSGDAGQYPNIEITGLSFAIDNAYYNLTFAIGNLRKLVADFLAGDDRIAGSSAGDLYISGFQGADVIHGNGGGDVLDGHIGNDTLFGDAGGDALGGSNGRDVLIGGAGADSLFPYAFADPALNDNARDFMRFTRLSDSGTTASTRDAIYGFKKGAGLTADRVDLSPIDANPSVAGNQAFHLVNAFTAAKGEVRLVVSGGDTIVQVDGDNDPAIDMTILVGDVTGLHGFDLIL